MDGSKFSLKILKHPSHLPAIYPPFLGLHQATRPPGSPAGRQVGSHVAPLVREVIAQLVIERPGLGIQATVAFLMTNNGQVLGKDDVFF